MMMARSDVPKYWAGCWLFFFTRSSFFCRSLNPIHHSICILCGHTAFPVNFERFSGVAHTHRRWWWLADAYYNIWQWMEWKTSLRARARKKSSTPSPKLSSPGGCLTPLLSPPLVMMCYFLCALSLSFFFCCVFVYTVLIARAQHIRVFFLLSQRPSGCLHAGVLNCLAGKLVLIEKSFYRKFTFF